MDRSRLRASLSLCMYLSLAVHWPLTPPTRSVSKEIWVTVVRSCRGLLLTGLLLFGPAGCFVGLTPDSDAILQKLQCSTLLPVRWAYLHTQPTLGLPLVTARETDWPYLHHAGALQHLLHILIVLHSCSYINPKTRDKKQIQKAEKRRNWICAAVAVRLSCVELSQILD